MTVVDLIKQLTKQDPNTAFAERELTTTVPEALALLDRRLKALEAEIAAAPSAAPEER